MDIGALALAAHRDDRLDEAVTHYRRYLSAHPRSGEAWLAFGMLLDTKAREKELALFCYRTALELMPNSSLAHWQIGTLLCELDRCEAAIVHLQRHIAAEPAPGGLAYAELACAHARLGQFAAAEALAARYCHAHPDDHFAPYLAAWAAALQGRLRDALAHAADCTALAPLWPHPLGLSGLLLSLLGEQEAAARVLQEMTTLHAGMLAGAVGQDEYPQACRLWRAVRAEAKQRLGLRAGEAAHFIVLPPGLGDALQTASMLGHFRRANDRLPLVVFCTRQPDWQLLFPAGADLFVHLPPGQIRQLRLCNRFFPDHPYINYFTWSGPLLSLATSQQLLRFQLGLPQHLQGVAPAPPPEVRAQSLALFDKLGGRPGRSVLIAPVSNSNPMVGLHWWQAMAERLHAAGFVVFQNMSNMADAPPPPVLAAAVPVALPVEQVVPFCEAGGHFAGVRSGLCDLLGHAAARMKAIHVTRRYVRNDSFPLSLWLDGDSGFGMRRSYRAPCWQDHTIGPGDTFDPAIIADWLGTGS